MTLPTHVLAGLIVGKVSGDLSLSLIGSLFADLDHVISYIRHGVLWKPERLLRVISEEADPWGDQRNFLHSIFSWFIVSVVFLTVNFKLGLIFSSAYFLHLILDAIDSADFRPFFPFKKFVMRGPIKYFSKQEVVFNACLVLILTILFFG